MDIAGAFKLRQAVPHRCGTDFETGIAQQRPRADGSSLANMALHQRSQQATRSLTQCDTAAIRHGCHPKSVELAGLVSP